MVLGALSVAALGLALGVDGNSARSADKRGGASEVRFWPLAIGLRVAGFALGEKK